MGKTYKGKDKAKAKIAKADRKIARKCKGGASRGVRSCVPRGLRLFRIGAAGEVADADG